MHVGAGWTTMIMVPINFWLNFDPLKKNYETYNRGEGFQFIARKVKV